MADDYQNRKDIDNLYNLIWDSDNNQIQFISREEFEEFKRNTQIIDLLGSSMDDSNRNFFDVLNDNFESIEAILVGDDENDGFIELLDTLQVQLYGKGGYDEEDNPYTYSYPSPNSVKGMLRNLSQSIGDLSDGDTKLAITLDALTSKLSAFSGTLEEFYDELEEENPDLANNISDSMVELVYAIAKTKEQVDDHKDRLDSTEALIGSETDSASTQDGTDANPYTVFGILNDASETATETSGKAEILTKTLYQGTGDNYDPSATPTNPADGSTVKLLRETIANVGDADFDGLSLSDAMATAQAGLSDAQGEISRTNGKIGNVSVLNGQSISASLKEAKDDVQTVYDRHLLLLDVVGGSLPMIYQVETLNDRDNVNGWLYEFVYVEENGKFYRWESY